MAEPKIAIDILVNCQSATSQLKKFNKELNNTVEGGKKASNWLAKGFGRLLGAYFGVRTAQNIFNTGKKMQLLERSILGLTKSTEDWEYIKRTAQATGNSLDTVANGYKNFYAAANMAGFNKNEIHAMFSDMTISTRAIGASSEQTKGALLALEQMISKGVVSMEELRRQLGNAVPGAFEIGAKAMNMTTKEFNEFVKTGQLASREFVPKFIAEFKRQYIGGFQEITQTVDFATGQLKESWQELTLEIMSGDVGKELASIIKELNNFLRSQTLKKIIDAFGKIFGLINIIVDFVKNNIPLVLILLGAGLYSAIMTSAGALPFLSMGFLEATEAAIAFGSASTASFLAANGALVVFLRTLMKIIFPLMIAEEIFTGLMHKAGLTNKKSVLGTYFDNQKFFEKMDKPSLRPEAYNFVPDFIKKDPVSYQYYKHAQQRGDWDFMTAMLKAGGLASPARIPSPNTASVLYNKNDNTSHSVTIGDVKVDVATNSNPQEIGLAVQNALANLFISQRIYNGGTP